MPADIKNSSMTVQEESGNGIEHSLKKTSSAQRKYVAKKVPVGTCRDKNDDPNGAKEDSYRWVHLSEARTMFEQGIMESELRRDSWVA